MMALRGTQKLHREIFANEETKKHRKGRSETLYTFRNECLIDRYYYYGKTFGLRYELLIEIVAKEFFLSVSTVQGILFNNAELIDKRKKELKDMPNEKLKKHLAKKWSHMAWNISNIASLSEN